MDPGGLCPMARPPWLAMLVLWGNSQQGQAEGVQLIPAVLSKCQTLLGVSALCSPGAVDEMGYKPFYAEECASMLAVTFSGGDKLMRSIVSRAHSSPSLARLLSMLGGGGAEGGLCLLLDAKEDFPGSWWPFPGGLFKASQTGLRLPSRQPQAENALQRPIAPFIGKGPGTGPSPRTLL